MTYDPEFFASISDDTANSAAVIVPLINDILQPESVLDVGCGTGGFAALFHALGVPVRGIDSTRAPNLLLAEEQFEVVDVSLPFVHQKAELVVCLEVAEHIPQPRAFDFVANLINHADIVLFSAAIPFQGGEGHVNEQWGDYWMWHFQQHEWVGTGRPRFEIWGNPQVSYWYQQNLFLYADPNRASRAALTYIEGASAHMDWRYVHPDLLGSKMGVRFQ